MKPHNDIIGRALHAAVLPAALLAALAGLAPSLHAQADVQAPPPPPACVRPIDPVQINPPFSRPTSAFPTREHLFVHSATHLQGELNTTKIAAGLIQRPADDLSGMTSAVVVDNPDPLLSTTVTITFFDHLGRDMSSAVAFPPPICATQTFTLAPEATQILAAVPLDPASGCGGKGIGSARVSVAPGNPGIVGAVLHHTYCLFGSAVCDTDSLPASLTPPPGATAMEQLQSIQATGDLWAGPFPLTASLPVEDILNGMAPIVSVTNPNAAALAAAIDLVIFTPATGTSVTVPFRPVVIIPAGGTWIESTGAALNELDALVNTQPPFPVGLWQQLTNALLGTPTLDIDVSVHVRSLNDEAILGNVLFTDVFANSSTNNLVLGKRFRIASTILQGQPSGFLVNPEFSFEPRPNQLTETYVMVQNVGSQATTVGVEYFDNLGNLMATGSLGSVAPNEVHRIIPGTHNYPAGGVGGTGPTGFGWMRIRACSPSDKLIGWSVREIFDPATHAVYSPPNQHEDHFMKAYGEILMSTAAGEPGNGFPVTISGSARTRKVSPLIRVDNIGWPGYSTAINDSVSNLFAYEWRIFNSGGAACSINNFFTGLPFRFATFTYEDPQTLPACIPFGAGMTGSARIDVSTGTVDGIDVIGDPLREYNIPGFADGTPPPIGGGGGGGGANEPFGAGQ